MKTRIITLAIASFFAFTNSASAKNENENENTTITLFSGNPNRSFQGDSKSINKYNKDGNLIERTVYTWDNGKWLNTGKYEWFYSDSKSLDKTLLDKVLYVQWDETNNRWKNKATETQYFYNTHQAITTIEKEVGY